jgi:hypothetical protein
VTEGERPNEGFAIAAGLYLCARASEPYSSFSVCPAFTRQSKIDQPPG